MWDWLDWDCYTKVCFSFTSVVRLSSVRSIGLQMHINNIAPFLQWLMHPMADDKSKVTGNIADIGGGINVCAQIPTDNTKLTITGSTVAIVV